MPDDWARAAKRRLRSTARAAIIQARLLTGDAAGRGLPDYIIIGAQKGGTTSLQKALAAHPDVCPSLLKEVHYFDLAYHRGARWYRAHFAREARRNQARKQGRALVMGEATPFYLAHPLAAERAAALVPDARLVVLLRNPVERAHSHYRHEVRMGHEDAPVVEALLRELSNGGGEPSTDPLGDPWAWQHRSYLQRGLYAQQLWAWMRWFPREQFLILRSEDYFANGLGTLDQVCEHLGIRPASAVGNPTAYLGHHNRGDRASPLPLAVRQRLEAYYAEPNRQLEQLLGRPMGW